MKIVFIIPDLSASLLVAILICVCPGPGFTVIDICKDDFSYEYFDYLFPDAPFTQKWLVGTKVENGVIKVTLNGNNIFKTGYIGSVIEAVQYLMRIKKLSSDMESDLIIRRISKVMTLEILNGDGTLIFEKFTSWQGSRVIQKPWGTNYMIDERGMMSSNTGYYIEGVSGDYELNGTKHWFNFYYPCGKFPFDYAISL